MFLDRKPFITQCILGIYLFLKCRHLYLDVFTLRHGNILSTMFTISNIKAGIYLFFIWYWKIFMIRNGCNLFTIPFLPNSLTIYGNKYGNVRSIVDLFGSIKYWCFLPISKRLLWLFCPINQEVNLINDNICLPQATKCELTRNHSFHFTLS